MRILCYGAGAVGCLVSGRLAAAGQDVALLARPRSAASLREHGITITTDATGNACTSRPRILTSLDEATEAPDAIILAVKGYDTEAAAAELSSLCGPRTAVLSLQNGLGNEEILKRFLEEGQIVAGSFTLSVSVPAPGQVMQHTSKGGIALAGLQPDAPHAAALAEAFAAAGLRVQPCADWLAMKWSKLLINMLANAACAILSLSPGAVFADARLFRLEQQAFREARRVMRRLRLSPLDLPGYPIRLLCAAMALPSPLARPLIAGRVAGGRGEKAPSLALDRARGKKRSEVEFLNGAVARAAATCGMRAPVNALLAETLTALVAGKIDPELYHHHPEALLPEC